MPKIGSSIPRRQLARWLRELRNQSGMTIAELAKLIERGDGTVQRLETGHPDVKIRLWDIEAICQALGADATTTEGLKGLAQQANTKYWWHEYGDLIPEDFDVYIGLEATATTLTSYTEIVPGLLQTPDYARSLFEIVHAEASASDIDRRVELRMYRQRRVTRTAKPVGLDVVLGESVLRRMVGGPKIMSAQLRHLADMSTRDNVRVRVLPDREGIALGDLTGNYTVCEFDRATRGVLEEPTTVYVESYTGALYFDDSRTVERYLHANARYRKVALDEQASRDLLRRTAREYTT
ncbi:helix-turn-helix domain-containing protein [Nocardia sp. NPDC003693]